MTKTLDQIIDSIPNIVARIESDPYNKEHLYITGKTDELLNKFYSFLVDKLDHYRLNTGHISNQIHPRKTIKIEFNAVYNTIELPKLIDQLIEDFDVLLKEEGSKEPSPFDKIFDKINRVHVVSHYSYEQGSRLFIYFKYDKDKGDFQDRYVEATKPHPIKNPKVLSGDLAVQLQGNSLFNNEFLISITVQILNEIGIEFSPEDVDS